MLVALVVAGLLVSAGLVESSILNKETCPPDLKPMANLDLNRILGTWYLLFTDDCLVKPHDTCHAYKYSMVDNSNFQYDASWLINQKFLFKANFSRFIDPSCPGVFMHYDEFDFRGLTTHYKKTLGVRSYIIYTDYDNIMLKYSCTQIDHFWHSETKIYFYVLIRDRAFNDLSKVLPLLHKLKELDVNMNHVTQVKNSLECNKFTRSKPLE